MEEVGDPSLPALRDLETALWDTPNPAEAVAVLTRPFLAGIIGPDDLVPAEPGPVATDAVSRDHWLSLIAIAKGDLPAARELIRTGLDQASESERLDFQILYGCARSLRLVHRCDVAGRRRTADP